MQLVEQNNATDIVIILTLDNDPVTDLTYSDVSCQFRKEGGTFEEKVLSSSNFEEQGFGTYTIQFSDIDLDTVGTLTIVVTGSDIDQSTTLVNVVEEDQESVTGSVSLQTCTIYGHVFDAKGLPVVGAAVSAKVIGLPSVEQSVVALSDDLVTVKTDSSGEFFITLVRLADVEIYIPKAGFRRRLVVPNQSSVSLFSIE